MGERGEEDLPTALCFRPDDGLGAVVAAVLGVNGVAGQDWLTVALERVHGVEPTGECEVRIDTVQDFVAAGFGGSGRRKMAVVAGPFGAEDP